MANKINQRALEFADKLGNNEAPKEEEKPTRTKPTRTKTSDDFDKAEKIRKAIDKRIGFDGELVQRCVGDSGLWTHSNATYGVFIIPKIFKGVLK